LLQVIDYQDYENGNYGDYWGPLPGVRKAKLKRKYPDAVDHTILKGTSVKLKKNSAIYTETAIYTTAYSEVSLSFVVLFKKMLWELGDSFLAEYAIDGRAYQTLIEIKEGNRYTINGGKWNNITGLEVSVEGCSLLELRLRLSSSNKGEAYIDHTLILGRYVTAAINPSDPTSLVPSSSPSGNIKSSSFVVLSYEKFQSGDFGDYWAPFYDLKQVKVVDKYRDPFATDNSTAISYSVRLAKNAGIEITMEQLSEYSTLFLEFYVLFKKMKWEKGDKLSVDYQYKDEVWKNILLLEAGHPFAANNEPNWRHVTTLKVAVRGAKTVSFRLRVLARKGEAHITHVKILGS
jgi:hypothetical protein